MGYLEYETEHEKIKGFGRYFDSLDTVAKTRLDLVPPIFCVSERQICAEQIHQIRHRCWINTFLDQSTRSTRAVRSREHTKPLSFAENSLNSFGLLFNPQTTLLLVRDLRRVLSPIWNTKRNLKNLGVWQIRRFSRYCS